MTNFEIVNWEKRITKRFIQVELTKWDSLKLYFIFRLCRFNIWSFVWLLCSFAGFHFEASQASTWYDGNFTGEHSVSYHYDELYCYLEVVFDSMSCSNIPKPEATPCPVIMNILRSSFIYPLTVVRVRLTFENVSILLSYGLSSKYLKTWDILILFGSYCNPIIDGELKVKLRR